MTKRNSKTVRAAYLAALIQGLGVTWPVLSGLLLFKAGTGAIVGVLEGWGIGQGIYFAFITGLTIGYGDLANFSRACRRWFGMTPRTYRRRLREADGQSPSP